MEMIVLNQVLDIVFYEGKELKKILNKQYFGKIYYRNIFCNFYIYLGFKNQQIKEMVADYIVLDGVMKMVKELIKILNKLYCCMIYKHLFIIELMKKLGIKKQLIKKIVMLLKIYLVIVIIMVEELKKI
jgi:hypothetical protein